MDSGRLGGADIVEGRLSLRLVAFNTSVLRRGYRGVVWWTVTRPLFYLSSQEPRGGLVEGRHDAPGLRVTTVRTMALIIPIEPVAAMPML